MTKKVKSYEEYRQKILKELLSSHGIDEKDCPKNERILLDEKSAQKVLDGMMKKKYYSIKKLEKLGNAKIIIPCKKQKPLVALGYLNDIAHGRKTQYDPQFLKMAIEQPLLAFEIIKRCFKLNGFDELIPNEKWWVSKSIQDFVKEMLK